MNTKRTLGILAVLATLLSACSGAATPAPFAAAEPTAPMMATVVVEKAVDANQATTGKPLNDVSEPLPRMVIRNATLVLVVRDTQAQLNAIVRLATEMKGFVASSGTTKDGNDLQAEIVLRVPSDRLDDALDRIRSLAVEVRQEKVSGDDVTAEYVDLNSRLKNLEAAEEQLRGILAKSDKTDDVLKVFEQLKNVRGEIEQVKGRMQYLSQAAAMSTVTLTLLPDKPAQPVEPRTWRPEGVVKDALEKLVNELQNLANVLIYVAVFLIPMLAVIFAPIALVVLVVKGINRRKAAIKTSAG